MPYMSSVNRPHLTPERLKERREAMGLHRRELALILGISLRTLQYWEEGGREMPSFLDYALDGVDLELKHERLKGTFSRR